MQYSVPPRARAGGVEREDLGVRSAGDAMRALTNHDPVGRHHDGANHRIGRRRAATALCQKQRALHEFTVCGGYHWSTKSALT